MAPRSLVDRLASRLSRRASGAIVPEMDGLRFPALCLVFLHHAVAEYLVRYRPIGDVESLPQDWSKAADESLFLTLVSHSGFVMPMFFTISGFVLALPFLRAVEAGRPRPGLTSFYLRRLFRIEPPYLIALAVFSVWRMGVDGLPVELLAPHLAASAFYLHNLVYGQASWVLGVAWSLEVEAQFYLLMPLLAAVFLIPDRRARRRRTVALIVAASLASQVILEDLEDARLRMSMLNFLQYFATGFLLADLYTTDWSRRASVRADRWDLAGLGALAALFAVVAFGYQTDIEFLGLPNRWVGGRFGFLLPWLVAGFYAAVLRGRVWRRALTQRWIVIGGGMCCGLTGGRPAAPP